MPGTGKTRLALSVALTLAGRAAEIDAPPEERAAALSALSSVPQGAKAARLTMAARRSTDAGLTRRLLDAASRFPCPRRPVDALPLLTRAQYAPLNQHYRPAHAWAWTVLGGGGVTDLLDPHGFGAKSLLLNLDVLWEQVVRRMAVEAGRRPVWAAGQRGRVREPSGPCPTWHSAAR